MKKIAWICLLAALMTMMVVAAAGAETACKHQNTEYVPNVPDSDSHSEICKDCGDPLWTEPHRANCDEPSVCLICNASCSTVIINHQGEWKQHHNENYHWYECDVCGERLVSSAYPGGSVYNVHYATCANPGKCGECGAPYTGNNLIHARWHLEPNADEHWYECNDCGKMCNYAGYSGDSFPAEREGHYANCDKPGVCAKCGVPYTGSEVNHIARGLSTIHFDANYHWDECYACGEKFYFAEHMAECKALGVCTICEAPYTGPNLNHPSISRWEGWLQYDAETHWYICHDCGLPFGKEEHTLTSDFPGVVCTVCGAKLDHPTDEPTAPPAVTPAPETPPSPSGIVVIDAALGKLVVTDESGAVADFTGFDYFEGAAFYFEHGVVRDDISGPVQIGSTWYAFDAGRVMPEQMLVPYDGGVFAFNRGVLDTTQNGLVTFNGQQFVFAAGQFQPNVYGAWHDPLSGDWVYVWEGQFYDVTDLVSYDGAIFYFINGRLALDFTGVVNDFKGTPFNIVNGQAQ